MSRPRDNHGMRVVVQKFGGSSLSSVERIRAAAERVTRAAADGWAVIAVVSAMEGETDRLLSLGLSADPEAATAHCREMDMLVCTGEQVSAALTALAIRARGFGARSMSARDLAIRAHGRDRTARLESVDAAPLREALARGEIPVVTGFQGVDADGNLVTLGRGSSDTTAVAVAIAAGAELCEIYTDVDGVHTADPHLCPQARKLTQVSYEQMLELAHAGAKVIHGPAVGMGMQAGIPIVVRSSFEESEGTRIASPGEVGEMPAVTGVARKDLQAWASLHGLRDEPDLLAMLFEPLSRDGLGVDLMTQSRSDDGSVTVHFALDQAILEPVLSSIGPIVSGLGGAVAKVDSEVARISVVGPGMSHGSGVTHRMFEILAAAGIPIHMALSTEIRTACVIPRSVSALAVRRLVAGFALEA